MNKEERDRLWNCLVASFKEYLKAIVNEIKEDEEYSSDESVVDACRDMILYDLTVVTDNLNFLKEE